MRAPCKGSQMRWSEKFCGVADWMNGHSARGRGGCILEILHFIHPDPNFLMHVVPIFEG